MISVTRTTKPTILQQNEQRWLAELQVPDAAVRAAQTDDERKQAVKEFKNKQERYAHPEIRQALVAMFGANGLTKCAFCEAHISHVSDNHIEHFRPKFDFQAQTFVWENLLIACTVCNRDYKKTQFPVATNGAPLLIDPTVDQPETHLDFVWDEIAQLATVLPKDPRGQATEHCLGLNRDELRDKRSQYLKKLDYVAWLATSDPQAKALLCEATQKQEEFAAFARALVVRLGISCP